MHSKDTCVKVLTNHPTMLFAAGADAQDAQPQLVAGRAGVAAALPCWTGKPSQTACSAGLYHVCVLCCLCLATPLYHPCLCPLILQSDVKKRIESLIDREYLQRCDAGYEYLA